MDTKEKIIERLKTLNPVRLNIIDNSAYHQGHASAKEHGGGHFKVEIISDKFNNLSKVQRHKVVYEAIGDLMEGEIHALQISANAANEI